MTDARTYFNELCIVFDSNPEEDIRSAIASDENVSRYRTMHGLGDGDPHLHEATESLRAGLMEQPNDRVMTNLPGGNARILWQSALEIEAAMDRRNLVCQNQPYIGVFNTGVVNAYAIRVPDSEHVIVAFDDGALRFFYKMSTLAALVLPVVDQTGGYQSCHLPEDELVTFWTEHISGRNDLIDYCTLVSLSYVWNLDDEIVWLPDFGGPGRFHISTNFNAGCRLFLVGHEYGHILAGHLDKPRISRFSAVSGKTVEVVEASWDQEYEADAYATMLAVGAYLAQVQFLSWSITSVDFFFTALHIVESLRDIASKKFMENPERLAGFSDSHPPLLERRNHVWRCLAKLFPHDAIQSCEKDCQFLRAGMRVLWEQTLPRLLPLVLNRDMAAEFVETHNRRFFERNAHLFGGKDA